MKRIFYSNLLKSIVALIFVASTVIGALFVADGIIKYTDEKHFVYFFEESFTDSNILEEFLTAPESTLRSVYMTLYYTNDGSERKDATEDELKTLLEKYLSELYCSQEINYYIEWNGNKFTNCGAESEKDLMTETVYRYCYRDKDGNTEFFTTQKNYYDENLSDIILRYDNRVSVKVITAVKDSYVEEYRTIWEKQKSVVHDTLTKALISILGAIVSFIYLLATCGKTKNGEQKTIWVDNVFFEIHLAFIVGGTLGAYALILYLFEEYFYGYFPKRFMLLIIGATLAVAVSVILSSVLSIIRNIKCKRFISTSAIILLIRWIFKMLVKIIVWIFKGLRFFFKVICKMLFKKSSIALIAILIAYTAVIVLCIVFAIVSSSIWIFAALSALTLACFIVLYRTHDIEEIKKGAAQVRNGNLTYVIPELRHEEFKALGNDINNIAKGLDESVNAKLKAERLKAELITNVSHDLKTPLTSIINYTELLGNIKELPEEARDYVEIIAKKSSRLKSLTQDLFDISKAQSGNEKVDLEKIDIALLINQSLGELDKEIKHSAIPFCVNISKELYVQADGKKLSRVITNLINNILKYTLKGTRVFISSFEGENNVIVEFKNIASYPMTFTGDEVVGRFVRGDESRTAEGNGLGLAIAKSYIELCGGTFEVLVDGDMFKAIIKFDKMN